MKLIAYLLPQFHRIPENDAAWGEGFTEWTNTKKSVPLYQGHRQPREPYNDYYYDLTDPAARQWQAGLAKKFGLHGFCYYHYWFKGKKLLEQPLEQMLSSGKPDFPFCLSWANESWTRKWDGSDNELILRQDYGQEEDWERHFDYLLQAFSDPRYIRIDNKPVFLIYRPGNIPCCEEMLAFWKRLALRRGMDGLFVVRTLGGFGLPKQEGFDASVEFEPHYTFGHSGSERIWSTMRTMGGEHLVFDYDEVWRLMLNRSPRREGEMIFPGAFVGWDNTPRLGVKGQSGFGASPHKFEEYLRRQLKRARQLYRSEFVFINAWNEWGEGAYLEPDKDGEYAYLKAVKKALESSENE
ncbi:glycosyltransferase WbsX family protein [Paenibacillus hubeiensis]|uniref:glycosyltransferase WbsX family protein n=1 Tax=Paenibacillus hubeiensis TaxID=3077330 RepID=UPI0031BBB6FD